MNRLLTFPVVILVLIFAGCAGESSEKKIDKEDIVNLEADDPQLEELKQQAQDEMDYLISFMAEDRPDSLYDYYIKAPFEDGKDVEHMWVETKLYKDGIFYGTLSNEPYVVQNIKEGDSVQIKREDVEDWILDDYETMTTVGGFSVEYMEEQGK